jgi:hypothetical protein
MAGPKLQQRLTALLATEVPIQHRAQAAPAVPSTAEHCCLGFLFGNGRFRCRLSRSEKKRVREAEPGNFDAWIDTTSMAECNFSHGVCGDSTPATHVCDDCNESLCLRCVAQHGAARTTKDHRTRAIPGIALDLQVLVLPAVRI